MQVSQPPSRLFVGVGMVKLGAVGRLSEIVLIFL